jgi:6-pyruvoyltetrahydropterin/6-carboxytetrahydropterin synthase
MFEITVEKDFAAAHRLVEYDGNCEKLHGHNWRVELTLKTETLNTLGLAVDFREARRMLKDALKQFDHAYLNELEMFRNSNPSCELIARNIFIHVKQQLEDDPAGTHVSVSKVTVWESNGSSVTFRETVQE